MGNQFFPFMDPFMDPIMDPKRFINITNDHPIKHGSTKKRDMSRVTHIVLHQAGCNIGNDPEGWYETTCHCGVTKDGKVLYVNDLVHPLWHGHGYNSYSIGIEIDGHYAGIKGDKRTYFGSASRLSTLSFEQAEATKSLLTWLVGQAVLMGGTFTTLVAHRQASDERDSDPGSAIWNAVGPWARETLGLKTPWWATVGSGRGLPRQWEPASIYGWWGNIDKGGIGMLQIACNKLAKTELVVDGIVGTKTRKGIMALNERLGLKPVSAVRDDTLELLTETDEYKQLVDWIRRTINRKKIPDKLRGSDFIDVIQNYHG